MSKRVEEILRGMPREDLRVREDYRDDGLRVKLATHYLKTYADYGMLKSDEEKTRERCMKASAEERLIILQCAISAAPGLEIAIYDSITSGSGYRTLLRMGRQIPAGEDDFYAYRRKTLAEISRYMRLLGRWKE